MPSDDLDFAIHMHSIPDPEPKQQTEGVMPHKGTATLLERHNKVGQVLGMAMQANHPCMIDWAEIGFFLKKRDALPPAPEDGETPRTDAVWKIRTLKDRTDDNAFILSVNLERELQTTLRENAGLKEKLAQIPIWTDDDKPLAEEADIVAAHPTNSGSDETFVEALRMVGAKRSKYGLVALVNWLLVRLQSHPSPATVPVEDVKNQPENK